MYYIGIADMGVPRLTLPEGVAMKFTLRQLQVFLATAHHENISKAAESLSMSQSAASGALKELEALYDLKFFERAGKRLKLN